MFLYVITFGFFLIGWLIDGFRLCGWLQAYTIRFLSKNRYADDSFILDVKNKKIMHKVRDAVYLAMAPDRQIDENNPTVSLVSSIEQENQADASQIINSAPKGGCCGILAQRTKFVITHDRLIMVKENQNGFKYEFTDLFLIDLQGLESTSPPAYPMWYVWLYWFPPAGLCGCHRYKLGQRGCGLYLYAVTLGYFGFRKISMFVLLAVVHEFSDIMLFLVCRLVD